jgi:beta-galactosidase
MAEMADRFFPYGGDYNPDQWPAEVVAEDLRLMPLAGWTIATLPVFAWSLLEPEEGRFEFEWLDEIIDGLHGKGIRICLATSTATLPAWLPAAYPDALVAEIGGQRVRHGERHRFCPSSPNFLRLSTRLAGKIAERYAAHPALELWHVSNEYCFPCWCEVCAADFQRWLQEKYETIENLNAKWWMRFWGHSYGSFSQIEPPHVNGMRCHQSATLDWRRFQSEKLLDACRAEIAAIREHSPTTPITTNMMGPFFPLDYYEWAKELDVVSFDSYPAWNAVPADVAFNHGLMRGLKGGKPFWLLEQSPSQQNWAPYNRLKAPGELRRQSWQAVAHGADSIMYFQWRKSRGGIEKLHGAVVEHGGDESFRVFQEVASLGAESARVGPDIQDSRLPARAAILFSWPCWWGLSASSGPNRDLNYVDEVRRVHRAVHQLGIPVDILSPEADLSGYDLILAPLLSMLRVEDGERITERVRQGATLITGAFSGFTNENDLVWPEGPPGQLTEALGIKVLETDALPPERPNGVRWPDGEEHEVSVLAERIALKGAEAMAHYTSDFYAGEPAITRHDFGQGEAWFCAGLLHESGMRRVVETAAKRLGIGSPLAGGAAPPEGLEVSERRGPGGRFIFLLNHTKSALKAPLPEGRWRCRLSGAAAHGEAEVGPGDVLILGLEE